VKVFLNNSNKKNLLRYKKSRPSKKRRKNKMMVNKKNQKRKRLSLLLILEDLTSLLTRREIKAKLKKTREISPLLGCRKIVAKQEHRQ